MATAKHTTTPLRRYECKACKGSQCRNKATVYVTHNGHEYLACKQHHNAEFRPC